MKISRHEFVGISLVSAAGRSGKKYRQVLQPIRMEGTSATSRIILRRVLRLAIATNVERHAHATEVEFRMTCAEDYLQITISDNGVGFDTEKKSAGNGLKNLPLRLSKLGGQYRIAAASGKGTVVTIGLRLAPPPATVSTSERA